MCSFLTDRNSSFVRRRADLLRKWSKEDSLSNKVTYTNLSNPHPNNLQVLSPWKDLRLELCYFIYLDNIVFFNIRDLTSPKMVSHQWPKEMSSNYTQTETLPLVSSCYQNPASLVGRTIKPLAGVILDLRIVTNTCRLANTKSHSRSHSPQPYQRPFPYQTAP